jgi:hypothetical protein
MFIEKFLECLIGPVRRMDNEPDPMKDRCGYGEIITGKEVNDNAPNV